MQHYPRIETDQSQPNYTNWVLYQHHGWTNQSVHMNQTTTIQLILMMTSAQVVEISVTITDNSPS